MNSRAKIRWGLIVVVGVLIGGVFLFRNTFIDTTNGTDLGPSHLAGPFKVQVAVSPKQPKAGRNTVTIFVADTNDNPVTDAQITSVAEMAAMGSMPAMRGTAEITQSDPGLYSGGFEIQMDGAWPLTLNIISSKLGSAELVFGMTTSREGLRLESATPSTCTTCAPSSAPSAQVEEVPGTIRVDARRRQLIGLTIGKAERRNFTQTIRSAGQVVYDETRLSDISLKFDGWIGELNANFLGAHVTQGEPLFFVYSPNLVAAQEEYLETLRRQNAGSSLLKAARQRLTLWDISATQIQELEKRGHALEYFPILAPRTGTVIEKNIVEGTAVKAGMTVLRIADLSKVWVEGQVYEYELGHIVAGMDAQVVLPGVEGRRYPAKIAYVYPYLENDTRTARIRVELENADGLLRPDMYAHVHVSIDLGERLVVPESAVLYAGDTRLVFLDRGDGYLEPRKIITGLRNDDEIEVLSGLEAGDRVVTSGNFLIASESKLKAGIDQW